MSQVNSAVPQSPAASSRPALPLHALKGHGTENDFVVLPDLDGALELTDALVQALCDRRAGLGADGVLRVMRTAAAVEPDVRSQQDEAEFFMDYRNADGSVAEMCGNGVRVFARYLQRAGLVDSDSFAVATRGGPKPVRADGGQISVDMGPATFRAEQPSVSVNGVEGSWAGVAVDLPNPHVVVLLPDAVALDALDLSRPPLVTPALPHGQNVEFVAVDGHRLRMRVHERGVGETRSCGTGICAAVVVAAAAAGSPDDVDSGLQWQVEVPGGRCQVSISADGNVVLTGPAVLLAEVEFDADWVTAHR